MKYCLFILMIFYGSILNKVNLIARSKEPLDPVSFFSQMGPIYFINSVPSKIKLLDRIDLTFMKSSIIVLYRYKLEIPEGSGTTIDTKIIIWSAWTENELTKIIIPRLDIEGGYKLIVEYKTSVNKESEKFEKPFYVYRDSPKTNVGIAGYKTPPVTDRTAAARTVPTTTLTTTTTTQVPEKTTAKKEAPIDMKVVKTLPQTDESINMTSSKTTTGPTSKTTAKSIPASGNLPKEKKTIKNKQIDLTDIKIKVDIIPKVVSQAQKLNSETSKKSMAVEKSSMPDYDIPLTETLSKDEIILLSELIPDSGIIKKNAPYGGNGYHLLASKHLNSKNLISILKEKGVSLNEPDTYGNSPLHFAILSGNIDFAVNLIDAGADINLMNEIGLSPLHLATFLNNREIVNALVGRGADMNLKGNSGYTPLHIASEMNYIELAASFLFNGAKNRIKTSQGLSPITIAKIQNNTDMVKLIRRKDSIQIAKPKLTLTKYITYLNYDIKPYPRIDFNLPFDKELAKKRQFNRVVQIISFPIFLFSTASAVYMKSEANHYYSLTKTAETEEMAKYYYDKTKQYDKNAYISGGVSLVSLYGFIHSTIKKKSISSKMLKTFN